MRFLEGAGERGTLELVAQTVLELVREGTAPEEIAVVCPSVEALRASLTELLERLNAIASEDNQLRLARTLENFELASARLEPALRAIPDVAERASRMFTDENRENVRRSLENLAQSTGAIAPLAEDSRQPSAR